MIFLNSWSAFGRALRVHQWIQKVLSCFLGIAGEIAVVIGTEIVGETGIVTGIVIVEEEMIVETVLTTDQEGLFSACEQLLLKPNREGPVWNRSWTSRKNSLELV